MYVMVTNLQSDPGAAPLEMFTGPTYVSITVDEINVGFRLLAQAYRIRVNRTPAFY